MFGSTAGFLKSALCVILAIVMRIEPDFKHWSSTFITTPSFEVRKKNIYI